VEFGILFNGDMVGMLLGDLGADVIKVESPGGGDYLREMHGHLAPHWSPTHLQVNKTFIRVDGGYLAHFPYFADHVELLQAQASAVDPQK
jgi:crotonobetainyl-CoA:carnitine CoA-transferase CaiB-like acyl-CoA transferase